VADVSRDEEAVDQVGETALRQLALLFGHGMVVGEDDDGDPSASGASTSKGWLGQLSKRFSRTIPRALL
jgi:hypothetical protein